MITYKKIKKLKRKVWLISTSILLIYIALLVANPSVWTGFIPIIIATSGLTIGIPIFDIFKHNNNEKNIKTNTDEYIQEAISNQTIKKNEDGNSYNKEVMIEDNIDVNEDFYKPKVKTKGTIN